MACALVLAALIGFAPAVAAPPPDPLPWERIYIDPTPLTPEASLAEVQAQCASQGTAPFVQNAVVGAPTLAVVGDSVQNQARQPSLDDGAYHWVYGSRCGENFGTVVDSGRLAAVLTTSPDVLVGGFGSNNFSALWQPDPAMFPGFVANLERYLDLTDGVPCRVLFTMPDRHPAYATPAQVPVWHDLIRRANDRYRAIDPVAHPNVIVADWAAMTDAVPGLIWDDQHMTHAGVNARINLAIGASRRCFAPDSPEGVHAVAGNGTATVWWEPLPEEEGITGYTVQASTGQIASTAPGAGGVATLNVPGLTNGVPVSFTVTATNQTGTSSPSSPSTAVTPSGAGARFHAIAPQRVLDTRDGTGGPVGPIGHGASRSLSVAAALPEGAGSASAVVVNITAESPTRDSFVTVWPGGQSRPLASSLNLQAGGPVAASLVTTRVGTGGTIQLFNNSGSVHLIGDVVGWFDQPGTGAGALLSAVDPVRVLDTRDGTGGPAAPFGAAETRTLQLDGLPVGSTAAVLNVTFTNATSPGFLTLYPTGTVRPLASSTNPQPGRTRANLAFATLGADRRIDLFNNAASTDVVIDLVGVFGPAGAGSGGAEYYPLTPERHLDTRDGTGGVAGPVAAGTTLVLDHAGVGAVPASGVTAIDANVTVVWPDRAGHTTAWPLGPRPQTSILNYATGEVVPNRSLLGLAPDGTARLWQVARTHELIDVSGWFGPTL